MHRSGRIWIVLVVFGALPVIVPHTHAQDAKRTIDNVRFPVAESDDFEKEIDSFADDIATTIAEMDRAVSREVLPLDHALKLLTLLESWPDARFHQPLFRLYAKYDRRFVFPAAEAIIGQRRPDFRKQLSTGPAHVRSFRVGDAMRACESIQDLLRRKQPQVAEPAFKFYPDSLVKFTTERMILPLPIWEKGVLVSSAIAGLRDPSLSVRLQSWMWLAEKGIVAPISPVVEAWPRLSSFQKKFVLRVECLFAGKARLEKLFLRLMQNSAPGIRVQFLVPLAKLGNEAALSQARQILDKKLNENRQLAPDISSRNVQYAFWAICNGGRSKDLSILQSFTNSSNAANCIVAMKGFVMVDEPNVSQYVRRRLKSSDTRTCYYWIKAIDSCPHRKIRTRWLYLELLAEHIEAQDALEPEERDAFYMRHLLETFDTLAQQDFSWRVTQQPSGLLLESGIPDKQECLNWYREASRKRNSSKQRMLTK